jgi:lysophospholipase L1-like esterase
MKQIRFGACLLLLICVSNILHAQTIKPFQNEINAFKKIDSLQPPPKHPILFVGSSSFTRWKNINKDFPGYPIVNRGFGGSSLTDVIHFAEETIFKYQPKQIYIYCGENDLAMDSTVSPEIVLERYMQLHGMIRNKLGKKIPIVFISIKPSISRWKLEKKYVVTNQLIKTFLTTDKHANYLDVHQPMLDEHEQVLKDIFVEDNLHMNAKGYAIWIKAISPTLLK